MAPRSRQRLLLFPVGDTPTQPLQPLREGVGEILDLDTRALAGDGRLALPDDAWEAHRGQHFASRILARLRGRVPEGTLVLGVANADLFAPGLSFVFGQADLGGSVAVISLTRLYPAFYGHPHDETIFQRRALIEAVHETGHLLGLGHCGERGCVMYFSSTILESDFKGPRPCPRCREIARLSRQDSAERFVPTT